MVATHIKKIKHGMLCIPGVYLRDMTNLLFQVLYLNVSHLSFRCSCFKKKKEFNGCLRLRDILGFLKSVRSSFGVGRRVGIHLSSTDCFLCLRMDSESEC